MSRGLTEHQARQMVVRGFFADVIRMIPSTDWRDRLLTLVDQRLGIAGDDHE
jgi:Fe-S cluster assembly protein SufD